MKEIAGLGHLLVCGFLYHFSIFVVAPALTDVTMAALCPGEDQCSLAIYLNGFQQAIVGLGSLVVTPIIGNLSDRYGRKVMLTLPMAAIFLPPAILSYGWSKRLYYVYYAVSIVSGIICKGSMQCLTLAYVADKVAERRRASAFGVVSGVSAAGFVAATIVARLIPTSLCFQISTAVGLLAAIYMQIFLVESLDFRAATDDLYRPIAAALAEDNGSPQKVPVLERRNSSAMEMVRLVRSSSAFMQAAIIAFLASFGDSGLQDSLLYILKARFQFSKDQFAELFIIVGIAGTFSQLVLMPIVVPVIGEGKLLSFALLANAMHIFLYSVAWASWVPYCVAMLSLAAVFSQPCLRSIVSKIVGPDEQGMAQGCISGLSSFANILAPVVITPLTALFLSDDAPFNYPGFSLMCIALTAMAAFVQSIMMMRVDRPILSCKANTRQHGLP